jgi:hypothetical protein
MESAFFISAEEDAFVAAALNYLSRLSSAEHTTALV